MKKLTKEQGIILTGYTGVMCCKFSDFHEDVEARMGRPIWTHEFADKEFSAEVKKLYKDDFLKMMPQQ